MTACTKSQFECSGKSCIAKTMICDGVKDCPNGEDERNCVQDSFFCLAPG